jgi:predicted kinase
MNSDAPERRVVIINGLPGTGKTTLGRAISDHFGWPFISKDVFKEVMFDTLGWSDKKWSLKVSAATHRVMDYVIGELLRAQNSLVVESNFKADVDAPRFERLRIDYGVNLIQILCWAEGDVLFERYKARLESSRHPGHAEADSLDLARASLARGKAEPLPIRGTTIEIDTTHVDAIDYSSVFRKLSAA